MFACDFRSGYTKNNVFYKKKKTVTMETLKKGLFSACTKGKSYEIVKEGLFGLVFNLTIGVTNIKLYSARSIKLVLFPVIQNSSWKAYMLNEH